MTYEERIQKMQADNLISDEQATALINSLSPLRNLQQETPEKSPVKAGKTGLIIGIVFTALVIGLSILQPDTATVTTNEIQNVREMLNTTEGTGAMNSSLSNLVSALILMLPVALVILVFAWGYNSLVDKEEKVYAAWAQVESNFQRRTDLIPNLVETVSRYMKHERETLTDITDERGDALNPLADAVEKLISEQTQAAEGADKVTIENEEDLQKLAQMQNTLNNSLKNLIAVSEDYPDLRSADQFLSLQSQLEGTENRINIARMNFNDAVKDFNSAIRRLPGSLIAGLGNFKRKAYFQTESGDDAPTQIDFQQE